MENVDKVVKEINDALFYSSKSEHDYMQYLEYFQTPIGDCIKYMGCYLWDSENDYRDYILDSEGEETEDKECLKGYLIKQMKQVSTVLFNSIMAVEEGYSWSD